MKFKIALYFVILLLSSCTVLNKTGIEKRRYRNGYYISFVAPKNTVHRQIQESKSVITAKPTDQTDNTVSELVQNADTIERNALKEPEMISPYKEPPPVIAKINTIAKKINNARLLHNLLTPKSAACAAQASKNHADWGRGCGNILADIIILLLAIIILALFPGMDPQVAELIATAVLIVVVIVAVVLLSIH